MKKQGVLGLIAVTAVYAVITVGLFVGRNYSRDSSWFSHGVVDFSASAPPEKGPEVGKVNLNTATLDELMILPGISRTLAQHILDYRQAHGSFRAVSDLKQVDGVEDDLFAQIADYITVGG